MSVNHVALLIAVQGQAPLVVRLTLLVLPFQSTTSDSLLRANVHGGGVAGACWVIVTVMPATDIDPVRDDVDTLGATEYAIVWEPEPLDPAGVIHALDEATDQPHPVDVVTVTEPAPPLAVKVLAVGLTEWPHKDPACETVTTVFASMKVPVRAADPVLGATVKVTFCAPLPPPLLSVIHDTELVAVHWHANEVLTDALR